MNWRTVESRIATTTVYDGNSRVTRLVDDRGGVTSYSYDQHDRETEMEFHDGATRGFVYNTASDVTQYADENGTDHTNPFDPLGRKVS